MGLTTAYSLAKLGHTVSLCDPNGFPNAHNASYIAGGMLAPYSEIDLMTPDFMSAGLESIALWKNMADDLGFDILTTGSVLIAHDEDAHMLARFERHLPKACYTKGPPQLQEAALPRSFKQGLFLPQEAALNPARVMVALCDYLQSHEAVTLTTDAADGDHHLIIDCTGYAAADQLPELRGVKGEIAVVENAEFSLTHIVRMMHPRYPLYIVPRPDNMFMIGATQIESSADSSVSVRSGLELLSALYSLHPSFGEAKIHALQAGIRPAYPDNLPRITRNNNVVYANGLFRHGYLLSPVIARDIVAMLDNDSTQSLFIKEAA